MITYTRQELMDVFDICGKLARHHLEASKLAATECNFAEAIQHKHIVDHYLNVREDLLKLMIDGV